MRIYRPPARRARIEIVPMIDTVFFLLVFFMVSSLSLAKFGGIQVDLPRASAAAEATPPSQIVVTISESGQMFLGKEPVTRGQLASALTAALNENPTAQVVVSADSRARHGWVVDVMDAAKRAGAVNLAIGTTGEHG